MHNVAIYKFTIKNCKIVYCNIVHYVGYCIKNRIWFPYKERFLYHYIYNYYFFENEFCSKDLLGFVILPEIILKQNIGLM
jgi:hypothetical protein